MTDTQQNKHGAAILAKMVEMVTLEMQIAGSDETAARLSAARSVSRSLSLLARALGALNLDVVYAPRAAPANVRDESTLTEKRFASGGWDLEAVRAANPGANVAPLPGGGFQADAPSLKFPITPPRPTLPNYSGRAGGYEPEDAPFRGIMPGGSLFSGYTPHTDDCDCETGPEDSEGKEPGAAYSTPPGQDAEDRLRIIAAVVDAETAYGTDMANFIRRLQKVLGA